MATKIDEAYIDLILKDKRFKQGMKDANRSMKGMKDTAKMVSTAIKGFFAFQGLRMGIGFLKGSIDALRVQIKAEQKLAGVLKATGNAAGFTITQLKGHASALQNVTTFGDEAIIGAQALLATFREVKGGVFTQATETILDMSAALGQDLKSSAIQLGKALNDPIKGITALSRVGVSFSEEQKDLIKNFVAMNDVASAQAVILKELANEFGGVAKAMAEGELGELDKLANQWGDIEEGIGKATLKLGNFWLDFKKLNNTLKKFNGIDLEQRGVGAPSAGELGDKSGAAKYDWYVKDSSKKLSDLERDSLRGKIDDNSYLQQRAKLEEFRQQMARRRSEETNKESRSARKISGGVMGGFNTGMGGLAKGISGGAELISRGVMAAQGAIAPIAGVARNLPSPAQLEELDDKKKKLAELDKGKPGQQAASFFGLSDFGRALQESIGKPDDQKERDDERNTLLEGIKTGTENVAKQLENAYAAFS